MNTRAPFYTQRLMSPMFRQEPHCLWRCSISSLCDHLPVFLLFSCSLNTLRENTYLFSSFCICFSTSFNSASVIPAAICEGLSSSQHLKCLCVTQRAMQNVSIEIRNPTRLTSFQNKTKSQAMKGFLFKPSFYIFLFICMKILFLWIFCSCMRHFRVLMRKGLENALYLYIKLCICKSHTLTVSAIYSETQTPTITSWILGWSLTGLAFHGSQST